MLNCLVEKVMCCEMLSWLRSSYILYWLIITSASLFMPGHSTNFSVSLRELQIFNSSSSFTTCLCVLGIHIPLLWISSCSITSQPSLLPIVWPMPYTSSIQGAIHEPNRERRTNYGPWLSLEDVAVTHHEELSPSHYGTSFYNQVIN